MKLGSFWGFTGPMFVLAFPDRNAPIPVFQTMAESANTQCLQDLQKELMYLQRIEQFTTYKRELKVAQFVSETSVWHDSVFDDGSSPELKEVFVDDVKRLCVAKIYDREKSGKYYDLANFDSVVRSSLENWHGELRQVDKLVLQILKQFESARFSMLDDVIATCAITPEIQLSDRVTIDGQVYTLSDADKSVLQYYMTRLPDIKYWVRQLNVSETKLDEVFNTNFFSLVRRNVKATRNIVYNLVGNAVKQGNTQVFQRCMTKIGNDAAQFRKNMEKYVHTDFVAKAAQTAGEMSDDARKFFVSLPDFDMSELQENDLHILETMYGCAERLTSQYLDEVFGYHCNNWNAEGERLSKFFVCGINQCQVELFKEAVLNTVLSYDTVYCEHEYVDAVLSILENDIVPLVETAIPIGEAI